MCIRDSTIGRPVEVVVTGILPSGGAVLTRTYHSALPDGAAATFAFYDEELGLSLIHI